MERKRLAQLGFMTPMGELGAFKAECFSVIDTEILKLNMAKQKKAAAERKRGK